MAAVEDDASVATKIQEIYVPFLKKLITFLEKNKKGIYTERFNSLVCVTIWNISSVKYKFLGVVLVWVGSVKKHVC